MLRATFIIHVRELESPLQYVQYQQGESWRIMNEEIELNNTVNKTVIEFNNFIHNYFNASSLVNGEDQLRRDGCICG